MMVASYTEILISILTGQFKQSDQTKCLLMDIAVPSDVRVDTKKK